LVTVQAPAPEAVPVPRCIRLNRTRIAASGSLVPEIDVWVETIGQVRTGRWVRTWPTGTVTALWNSVSNEPNTVWLPRVRTSRS
jgi:hypothetical protein